MVADVELFFDPVCPFCWVTSKWIRQVQRLRGLEVDWRLISLAVLNDRPGAYDDAPAAYPAVHGLGRDLLRVVAAARHEHGREVVGDLYRTMGEALWEVPPDEEVADVDDLLAVQAKGIDVEAALTVAGLAPSLAAAAHDEAWDETLVAETREALARVGDEVGTPILSFSPPDGPAFFGPVISDTPADDEAVATWDALVTLARMPGFAELKRTLRSFPVTARTAALGGTDTTAG